MSAVESVETVIYPCGCSATGAPSIPRYCPTHGDFREQIHALYRRGFDGDAHERYGDLPETAHSPFDKGYTQAINEVLILLGAVPSAVAQLSHSPKPEELREAIVKCNGTHAGPRCADPECWNQ